MTEPPEEGEALNVLARKYLDLWLEYWASTLAAPEAASMMLRLFTQPGGAMPGAESVKFDATPPWSGAGIEPAPFRTAPNAGGGGADELEKRIAELEQRLAELRREPDAAESSPALAKPARKPRGGTRKI